MNQRTHVVVVLITMVLVVSVGATAQEPSAQQYEPEHRVLEHDGKTSSDFSVQLVCSETKRRTVVGRLRWRTNEKALSQQRIDVTVYKHGFDRGFFTSLTGPSVDRRFVASSKIEEAVHLHPALYLTVTKVEPVEEGQSMLVELEGLESGLNYFLRVLSPTSDGWVPSETLMVMAPICPDDSQLDERD